MNQIIFTSIIFHQKAYQKKLQHIIDWYIKKEAKNKNFIITHNVLEGEKTTVDGIEIYPISIPFKNKIKITFLIKYLFNAIIFSFKSFFKIFTEDFTNPLILKEFPLLYFCKKAKTHQLAKKYFFITQLQFLDPFGPMKLEKKSKIIFFYYSTNNTH